MKRRDLRFRVAAFALAALVSLVGLSDFLPHTDDGCAVEVHCLACRVHLNAVSDVALAATYTVRANVFVGLTVIRKDVAADAFVELLPPGRAPPYSA